MRAEVEVSVALTVRDEVETIERTLSALVEQTLKPAEIIVADGGSTDGTPELVEEFSASSPVPVRLLRLPPCNRSAGRNAAVRAARSEIVAMTDGGCVADPHWLEELTRPFTWPEPPDVVGGYYEPLVEGLLDAAAGTALVPLPEEIDPKTFLPSSRSVAFRRAAWEAVGGYPEHLSHNEDTPFALALRRSGFKFAFAPKAVVRWRVNTNPARVLWQFLRYAYGDGESGLFFGHYLKLGLYCPVAALAVAGGRKGRAIGAALLGAYFARQFLKRLRRCGDPLVALLSLPYVAALDIGQCIGYPLGWAGRLIKQGRKANRNLREGRRRWAGNKP